MQVQSNPKLFSALAEALPQQFLEGMLRGYAAIAAEAHAEATESPLIDPPEAQYLEPHLRRAMLETHVRRQAEDAGLTAFVKTTKNETARFSVIKAGVFVLTASYVPSPGAYVRPAVFRAESAVLNEFLEQGDFFGFEEVVRSDSEEIPADAIYGILLYGGSVSSKGNTTFMEVAFPHPDRPGYVDRYSCAEILAAKLATIDHQSTDEMLGAFPKPKHIRKDGTEGGNEAGR